MPLAACRTGTHPAPSAPPPVGCWVGRSTQQRGDAEACDSVWLQVPGGVASGSPGEGVGFGV